jgi:hypothetical protein
MVVRASKKEPACGRCLRMALITTNSSTSRLRPNLNVISDDYDVLDNGVVVGRIFISPAAPQDRPWMWARATMVISDLPHTDTSRRARRRWRRSQRVGAER